MFLEQDPEEKYLAITCSQSGGRAKKVGRIISLLDLAGKINRLKVGRAESRAGSFFNLANEAESMRGGPNGETKTKPPPQTGSLVVSIYARDLDGVRATLGVLTITKGGSDALAPESGHALNLRVIFGSGTAWTFGGAGFANA